MKVKFVWFVCCLKLRFVVQIITEQKKLLQDEALCSNASLICGVPQGLMLGTLLDSVSPGSAVVVGVAV